jgi:uncharacterized protein YfaS (alpha-2-macroglobulin family)
MKRALAPLFLTVWLGFAGWAAGQGADAYDTLRQRAAQYYSEQSFGLAYQGWSDAAKLGVPEADRRILEFYLADSLWRSHPDAGKIADARRQLDALAAENDSLAAEAAESLGDSWLALEKEWSRAWTNYERALKFWAASADLETARTRYLGIVWKATGPPTREDGQNRVPLDFLVNALTIATTAEDRARAHFFLGRWYGALEDPLGRRRAGREYQAAVDAGRDTAVYEMALYELASWNLAAGSAEWRDGGRLTLGPNYDRALELFERFVRDFPKGKSSLTDRAAAQIKEITRPALELRGLNQFLPGASPAVRARWRNVGDVQFTLFRVDLSADFYPNSRTDPAKWIEAVRPPANAAVRQWTEGELQDLHHAASEREIELGQIKEPGVYLVEARGGGLSARTLLVVTEVAAILQPAGDQAVAFLCDARTGVRAAEGSARLWRARAVDDGWRWQVVDGAPAKDGLIGFSLPKANADAPSVLYLFGRAGVQPVVARGDIAGEKLDASSWRLQTFTDRAVYHVGDTVHWKLIARKRTRAAFATPAGDLLKFVIFDSRGAKASEGQVKLTEFGGAWGDLALRPDFPLGEYRIEFWRGSERVGGGTLFRIEETASSEFKVSVNFGSDSRSVRLGDEIEAKVSAEYNLGGAVADAKVVFEVREEAYDRFPHQPKADASPNASGVGRVAQRETMRTNPGGAATIRVPTPLDAPGELLYTIVARVTDSSGKTVEASGSVVIGRQAYFVGMKPSRRVVRPKQAVEVVFNAKNGSDRPVATTGKITVSRQRWTEVWLDPQGKQLDGDAIAALKSDSFPPKAEAGWRLIKREYVGQEVAKADVSTDVAGRGVFKFRPDSAGYYRIEWSSPDGDGPPVRSETTVWVSAATGDSLGYHSNGVRIIADPEAPAGEGKLPVLIVADRPNRDILLVVSDGGALLRSEVLHLDGDSRLLELSSDPHFVPNVFLTAAVVRDLEFFSDTAEVRFPPFRNSLKVELRPSEVVTAPGQEATIRLAVKDSAGKPVQGEFALSVVDDAGGPVVTDSPVDFFLGEPRSKRAVPTSSISLASFFNGDGKNGEAAAAFPLTNAVPSIPKGPAPKEERSAAPAEMRTPPGTTALWRPGIVTDAEGLATVRFKYPNSLAGWRMVSRGATSGSDFGFAETTTQTTKALIAQLQMPEFLVAGDEFDAVGVISNRAASPVNARAELEVEGLAGSPRVQNVRIEPDGDGRARWRLTAPEIGTATVGLAVSSSKDDDAATLRVPIVANGLPEAAWTSGVTAAGETKVDLMLPAERRHESLLITASPSLATVALDALPEVITYPYDSVEQTLGRFLPAAVTARTLQALGFERRAVVNRIFENINEDAPRGRSGASDEAAVDPLESQIAGGLRQLAEFQREDGSWAWWKGGESDAFMTAYVVWGLRLAQQAGVGVRSDMLERGSAWLRLHFADFRDQPELQAWLLHALASGHDPGRPISGEERAAVESLWQKRDQLTACGQALFALAASNYGQDSKARTLAQILRDRVVRDQQTNSALTPTVHWGNEGPSRRWQDGGIGATAFSVQALLAIDPRSELIESAMRWLITNRRGTQWSNTRDTAVAILTIDRYLDVTKQSGKPMSFEVEVNGRKVADVSNAGPIAGRSRFEVDRALLRAGSNEIVLKRTAGDGPLYFSALADFFTTELPILAAGNELAVSREYFRYAPQLTLLDGYRFDRALWGNEEVAAVDQRVEVSLMVTAKSDLEYVLVEDHKPSGLNAVNLQNGEVLEAVALDGARVPVHCQLRERKVAFFMRKLPAGNWTIRYGLSTATAGNFSALPAVAHAMYAPEIRGNSDSRKVTIEPGS